MSGIYIKGMKIPPSCFDCDMIELSGAVNCVHAYDTRNSDLERAFDCPLVPVPDHSELIEREKLYEQAAKWEAEALDQVLKFSPEEDAHKWRWWSAVLTERSAFKFDVADAPTIIPAETEEIQ